MSEAFKITRVASLKTVATFARTFSHSGSIFPAMIPSALATLRSCRSIEPSTSTETDRQPLGHSPDGGWDATPVGGATEEVRRRWQRFGESGAKLIYGGEAMAVRPDGRRTRINLLFPTRTKPILPDFEKSCLRPTRSTMAAPTTWSSVFSSRIPADSANRMTKSAWNTCAYRHPLLDRKFHVTSDQQVFNDAEIEQLILDYIAAARIAWEAGADFVDLKHCHGYLLHEFLSAFTRPGKFGGSFENRTRILREIIAGIRAAENKIEIGVRLSAFRLRSFQAGRLAIFRGRLGPGIPEDFSQCLPYRYAFGANQQNPVEYDLADRLDSLSCAAICVKIVNLSAGSPYYNPHIQRPAAYPPSDGYQPAHDPLSTSLAKSCRPAAQEPGAARHDFCGSAYSYLQEYLPHVAQSVIRERWTDMVGIGRMTLSYPRVFNDAVETGALTPNRSAAPSATAPLRPATA